MENSSTKNRRVYSSDSLHSQICLADNIDFIYRKAYKGDWGHWDDLPDMPAPSVNCPEKGEIKNSVGKIDYPNENSYL